MSDVDINKIRPSGNDTLVVTTRTAPGGLAPCGPRRESERLRSVGKAWRQNLRDTQRALNGPVTADVQGRIKEARRLSRPDETGVR